MIDYSEYPPNWLNEIRPRILARARNKCEWCGVENHSNVAVWPDGRREVLGVGVLFHGADPKYDGAKLVRVVLTVAHLDHDKLNHEVTDQRLAALCQRCHLNYDRPHHLAVQKANRERFKGPTLFDIPSSDGHLVVAVDPAHGDDFGCELSAKVHVDGTIEVVSVEYFDSDKRRLVGPWPPHASSRADGRS